MFEAENAELSERRKAMQRASTKLQSFDIMTPPKIPEEDRASSPARGQRPKSVRVQEESSDVIRGSKRSMRSENPPSRRTVSVETQTDITLPERTTVIWNCHCVSADSIVDQHPDEAQEVDGDASNIQEEQSVGEPQRSTANEVDWGDKDVVDRLEQQDREMRLLETLGNFELDSVGLTSALVAPPLAASPLGLDLATSAIATLRGEEPDSIGIGEGSISTLSEKSSEEPLQSLYGMFDYDELETSMPIEEDPGDDDDRATSTVKIQDW